MINDPDDSLDGVFERLIAMPDADVGRGASRAEIADAEAKLATKIPSEYRAFLLRVGWGGCDGWELLGLGEGVPPYLHLVTVTLGERTRYRPKLPARLLPIMNDGGLNLLVLDLSSEEKGHVSVQLWNLEDDEAQQPLPVAESFTSWLIEQVNSEPI